MAARNPALALDLGQRSSGSSAVAERILNFVLFVTLLTSFIAIVEPSPHDALVFVLLVACIAARVPFDRKLVPLLGLMIVWLIGGALSLIQVGDDKDAIQYFGTSVYLDIAAITFACIFSGGDLTRLATMRRGYLFAALIASATGYIGFFHLLPGSDMFLEYDRVSATFKDPNVYAPFLVFPMLMLMLGFLTQRITFVGLVALMVLMGGLFLSFSRGAWVHFALSALLAVAMTYATAQTPQMRTRIVAFGVFATIVMGLFVIALMSIGSVHDMFVERAKAIQPYDVGSGGRFSLQQVALSAILDHPFGLGPFQFWLTFGAQQHNVYMQGFLVYGWLGGATYLALIWATLLVGLRCVFFATPWQPYLIAAFAAYVGEVVEGVIIDTDHWRHFFLLVGLVWGLSVATINYYRQEAWRSQPA